MVSSGKAERQAARNARLAAALRENLKRRKAQARGRKDPATPEDVGSAESPAQETTIAISEGPDFRRNRSRD
jgi:hypothetical protein